MISMSERYHGSAGHICLEPDVFKWECGMVRVVLLSTYELGHQPFGLASPAAWLRSAGADVTCLDLAVQSFSEEIVASADLVALYIPMHTATRLAVSVAQRVRRINPAAYLCFYGLYAPANEQFLRELGADAVLGGEYEEGLLALVKHLMETNSSRERPLPSLPLISLSRQKFLVPDRDKLAPLNRYAYVTMPDRTTRTSGYTEASRGCKHKCRHCPIVPVYDGSFRVVQREIVLADIEQQVNAGARHITFGDPDFFNGPAHAIRIVKDLHERWPDVTYDVTIKVEHILKNSGSLEILRATGCILLTSAVESVDDRILMILDKGHSRSDFLRVVSLLREAGLVLNPTFVTFTPWTSLEGYSDLLRCIRDLDLLDNVSPVQYAIRLLVPAGSRLLELPEAQGVVGAFNADALSYTWSHSDPAVDQLYADVFQAVKQWRQNECSRRQFFNYVYQMTGNYLGLGELNYLSESEQLDLPDRAAIPWLSEPWFC